MTRHRGRGQSLVEFALVLPVFLLMLLGLFDVGRLVYLNSTVSQAAREGARLASVEASWMGSSDPSCNKTGGPVCPANLAALQKDVRDAVNRMVAPFATVPAGDVFLNCVTPTGAPPTGAWTTQTCASSTSGSQVSVRVRSTFSPIAPLIGFITGNNVPVAGAATMIIN